jgi:hypothetical protein
MRSVRSALVGLGTLIVLVTFVGFATFSADVPDRSRPETPTTEPPQPLVLAADAGAATGRVTAFVFANQLQTPPAPRSGQDADVAEAVEAPEFMDIDELMLALVARRGSTVLSSTATIEETSTTTTTDTTIARPITTTTAPTTTTTEPPTTTTEPTTTTTEPPTTTTEPTTTTSEPPTTTTEPPTTTTTTPTPPSSGPLSESEMRALASLFFPAAELDKAVLVARCESNYDPAAYNPAGPYLGLYQHSLTYWEARAASAGWAGASIYDASANTAVTAWLVARDGWGHWPWCSIWADGQLGG